MAKESTRDTLLEVGRKVFLERGFNHAGLETILQEAGVPKGSFYHYFESKEDFGLQVLERFVSRYDDELSRCLDDRSIGPLERLRRLGEATCERFEAQQCRNGCLVGTLSQELSAQSEPFRSRLEAAFQGWSDRIAECLGEAQAAGLISPRLEVCDLADFWLNGWQGAILRAKTIRSTRPMRTFLDVLFRLILEAH